MSGDRLVLPAHVVVRELPRETIVLNLRTGVYHSLNGGGTRFLRAIQDAGDLAAAGDDLCRAFDVPEDRVRDDLRTFARQLIDLGLLEAQTA